MSVNRLNDENYFILFTLLWLPDSIRHGHFVVFMLSVRALLRAGGGNCGTVVGGVADFEPHNFHGKQK